MDFFLHSGQRRRENYAFTMRIKLAVDASHLSILLALPSCSSYLTQREWKVSGKEEHDTAANVIETVQILVVILRLDFFFLLFSSVYFFSVVNEGKQREIFTHEKSLVGPERTNGLLTEWWSSETNSKSIDRLVGNTHVCVGSRVDFLTIARLLSQSFSTTFQGTDKSVSSWSFVVVIEEKRKKYFQQATWENLKSMNQTLAGFFLCKFICRYMQGPTALVCGSIDWGARARERTKSTATGDDCADGERKSIELEGFGS